jgi:hypothetical protein
MSGAPIFPFEEPSQSTGVGAIPKPKSIPLIHESYVELCRMQLAGFQALLGEGHSLQEKQGELFMGSLKGSILDGGPLTRGAEDNPSLLEQVLESLKGQKEISRNLHDAVAELQRKAVLKEEVKTPPEGNTP